MKCPYCKKEIKTEEPRFRSFGIIMINMFIPLMVIAVISSQITNLFHLDLIKPVMFLMIAIGIFYIAYGLLWEFGKVKGRWFITNLLQIK